jgi:hypothetical protein
LKALFANKNTIKIEQKKKFVKSNFVDLRQKNIQNWNNKVLILDIIFLVVVVA